LNQLRSHRDSDAVNSALDTLQDKAKTTENLMLYIMDTVIVYATVGEITRVFKEVFGEFKEPVKL
jgi:methylmalonyl-CoA mutase N-terminal domain/subunit